MATRKTDALVDEGSEESFPASDPPSYMGSIVTGAPSRSGVSREPPSTELLDDGGRDVEETAPGGSDGRQGAEPTDLKQRIRMRAYEIWERAGHVFGRAEDHWYQAERELTARPDETGVEPASAPGDVETTRTGSRTRRANATVGGRSTAKPERGRASAATAETASGGPGGPSSR